VPYTDLIQPPPLLAAVAEQIPHLCASIPANLDSSESIY
jgi:hypothetical protein